MGVADTVIRGAANIGERMGGFAEGAAAREELCTSGVKLFSAAYENVAALAKPVAKSEWREEMQLYEAAKKTGFAETRQKLGLATDIGRNTDQLAQPLGSNLARPLDTASWLGKNTRADGLGSLRPQRSYDIREVDLLKAELEPTGTHKVAGISQHLRGADIDAIGKGTYGAHIPLDYPLLKPPAIRTPHPYIDPFSGDKVYPHLDILPNQLSVQKIIHARSLPWGSGPEAAHAVTNSTSPHILDEVTMRAMVDRNEMPLSLKDVETVRARTLEELIKRGIVARNEMPHSLKDAATIDRPFAPLNNPQLLLEGPSASKVGAETAHAAAAEPAVASSAEQIGAAVANSTRINIMRKECAKLTEEQAVKLLQESPGASFSNNQIKAMRPKVREAVEAYLKKGVE